jgi:hypothetical protein
VQSRVQCDPGFSAIQDSARFRIRHGSGFGTVQDSARFRIRRNQPASESLPFDEDSLRPETPALPTPDSAHPVVRSAIRSKTAKKLQLMRNQLEINKTLGH